MTQSHRIWYYLAGESKEGPFTKQEMLAFLKHSVFSSDTSVSCTGSAEWIPANESNLVEASQKATIPNQRKKLNSSGRVQKKKTRRALPKSQKSQVVVIHKRSSAWALLLVGILLLGLTAAGYFYLSDEKTFEMSINNETSNSESFASSKHTIPAYETPQVNRLNNIISPPELKTKITPIIHFSFDEGAGTTIGNMESNRFFGKMNNMNDSSWVEGVNGKALFLDGVDDFVEIPNSPFLDIGNKKNFSFTVSLWIMDFSTNGTILAKGISDSSLGLDYSILLDTNSRTQLIWGTGPSSKKGGDNLNSWMTREVDFIPEWNHLLATFQSHQLSSGKALYLNGKLVSNSTIGKKNPSRGGTLKIGCQYDRHFWRGKIDEFKVYHDIVKP
jgi:hypothetical protein